MSRKTLAVFTALAGSLLAEATLPGSALAQEAVGDSVLGRPRPGYDPLGIDLFAGPSDPGSPFILFPTLDVAGGWDDNVFLDEDDPESDFFLLVSPALRLESDWVNHGLSLGARADIARYERFGQNDVTAFELDAAGHLDVALETQVFAAASFGRIVEGRDDVNNTGTNDLIANWRNTQQGGMSTAFGDFQFNVIGERVRNNYVDNGPNQDDRDHTQWGVSSRLGYEFQPGTILFVEGGYNWRRYDDSVDDFGFNRDSEGWNLAGGLSYDVTGVLFAEVSAGYIRQTYEDPRFGRNSGFTIDGDIVWNPTDLLTVRGSAGTSINETTLNGASGGRQIYGGVGLDYELTENLLLTTDGVYSAVTYEPATGFGERKDDIWQGSAGLIFLVNEFFQLRADYTFTTRSSSAPGQDFTDNTILLTLRSQL